MNNKFSFLIIAGFLFMTVACKSETKPKVSDDETPNLEVSTDDTTIKDADAESIEAMEAQEVNPSSEMETTKKAGAKDKTSKNSNKSGSNKVTPDLATTPKASDEKINPPTKKEEAEIVEAPKKEEKPSDTSKNEKPQKPEVIETMVGFPTHKLFDDLLHTHVSTTGSVDYQNFKKDESKLDEYLSILQSNPPAAHWDRNQKLAYWINAYNAYTIKLILKNYPLKSITDLEGGKPWDKKWINLDGKSLSLNNIENDIIRPKFNEPRIHFAVNCAAKSCPPLLNSAYTAQNLNAQLESQTKKFINNPKFNTLSKDKISVSKIFDWYGADFGDIATYIAKYSQTTVKPSASVSYMEYDWALNGK